MNFGQNLKKLRKLKKISQEELAEKVRVSRQSVSKWETGEAYPEMNNILELCKIFHCHINDLVNDSILDIDSLDDDVKMNAVKFKKEKQKQMKGLSKVISLFGKIGGIVVKVFIPFVIIGIILVPLFLKNISVENGQIVSNNNSIKINKFDNSFNIGYKGHIIIDDINNEDINKLENVLRTYPKGIIVICFEIGFVSLLIFLIMLSKLLKHLELLFDNINNGDTPFTLDNVEHIKKMSYLMIICIVLSGIGETALNFTVEKEFTFGLELFDIIEILFLYSMSLIFEYGYEIQLDSKGRIYGEDNE